MGNVSRCCGCSYEDSFISDCCNVEMYKFNKFSMEDFDDKCPSCEKDTTTSGYICNECGNWVEEPEERAEWEEKVLENHYEEIADAKRKYGE